MATLNEYASRIVGITGRPSDHAMRERVKAAFKSVFASRIRQTIAKNGIDDSLILTLELPIETDPSIYIKDFKIFRATVPVPTPLRFANDSPFVFVGVVDGEPFNIKTLLEIKLSRRFDNKGFSKYYTFDNNLIKLFIKTKYKKFELKDTNYTKVILGTIFENPEEVIGYYTSDDSQDIELPFPSDMLESVILEVLKTEFNIIPPETEVKV